jgi:maleate isomerase
MSGYGPIRGVMVPQANTTVEPEMRVLLAGTLLSARLRSRSEDSRTRLVEYLDRIEEFLLDFDTAPLLSAGFACTASSYFIGPAREDAVFDGLSGRRGHPVLSAARSLRAALSALGARRIGLVSPYPAWLHDAADRYWRDAGFEPVRSTSLAAGMGDTRAIYKLSAPAVDGLTDIAAAVDAIVISGTGMPSLPTIAAADRLGVPVVSSNLCLAWAMSGGLAAGLRDLLAPAAAWRARLAEALQGPEQG